MSIDDRCVTTREEHAGEPFGDEQASITERIVRTSFIEGLLLKKSRAFVRASVVLREVDQRIGIFVHMRLLTSRGSENEIVAGGDQRHQWNCGFVEGGRS